MLENLGSGVIVALIVWKLVDKWANKFIDAQAAVAASIGSMAEAVRQGMVDQREVLIAVRVLARQIEELKAKAAA